MDFNVVDPFPDGYFRIRYKRKKHPIPKTVKVKLYNILIILGLRVDMKINKAEINII